MPEVSKETAPQVEESPVLFGRYGDLDGYMGGFEAVVARNLAAGVGA
ncbi:MAG TPA: hypothetical protein VGF66_09570 [Gaiellaceae bacterium]